MHSHVLVPMDDSEHSRRALEYALENYPEAEITVLHVVGTPSTMMGDATALALEDDPSDGAIKRSEAVFDRAREMAAKQDRELNTIVDVGHPARKILARAGEYDALVLGAHDPDWRRATRRFLVGNVAETVSKRAPVSVVLVR